MNALYQQMGVQLVAFILWGLVFLIVVLGLLIAVRFLLGILMAPPTPPRYPQPVYRERPDPYLHDGVYRSTEELRR